MAVLEEELGDDEVSSVVDLRLEPSPVLVLAFAAGDVSLGESGDADGERAELADAANQLVRVLEAPCRLDELVSAVRRIAAQREDVSYPKLLRLFAGWRGSVSIVVFTHVRCAIAVICCSR